MASRIMAPRWSLGIAAMLRFILLGILDSSRLGLLRTGLSLLAILHLLEMGLRTTQSSLAILGSLAIPGLRRTWGSLAIGGLQKTWSVLADPAKVRRRGLSVNPAMLMPLAALGMGALPSTPASRRIRAVLESANIQRIAGSLMRRDCLTIRGSRKTASLRRSPDLFETHRLPRGGGTG